MKAALARGVATGELVKVKASYKVSAEGKKKAKKPAAAKAKKPVTKKAAPKKKVSPRTLETHSGCPRVDRRHLTSYSFAHVDAQTTTAKKVSAGTGPIMLPLRSNVLSSYRVQLHLMPDSPSGPCFARCTARGQKVGHPEKDGHQKGDGHQAQENCHQTQENRHQEEDHQGCRGQTVDVTKPGLVLRDFCFGM